MNIAFNFKNFEPSDHLKDYARKRFDKLGKYVDNREAIDLQVNLNVDKIRHMAEVILTGDSLHVSAYQESEDMYSTIDLVLDKIEAQVKKFREKGKEKKRTSRHAHMEFFTLEGSAEEGEQPARNIVSSDDIEPKPMDVEEAAMQLEALKYEFLVFRNAETERINIIYRRKNNDFGLIDPGT